MELLLATAALTAALSAPARAYKTYSLSTGENFGLESFLRFEGALVIRDEDEEEVRPDGLELKGGGRAGSPCSSSG